MKDKKFLIKGPVHDDGSQSALEVSKKGVREMKILPTGSKPEGEVIEAMLRDVAPGICEVVSEKSSGPSQVSNEAYRDGWSRIFGGKQEVGQA